MTYPLLLDEMLAPLIAQQLRERGHDVTAVAGDPELRGLPDDQILAAATTSARALVTANIKDFLPLDAALASAGRNHGGLVLVPTRTFPQDRAFIGAVTESLDKLLAAPGQLGPGRVVFLQR